MIFSFLCWTVVPTARLPPALRALSGCLSIDSWLLPLKFNCSFSPLQLLSSCSQETWLTQLHAYPEKRCRINVFASSPWNSQPCEEGESVESSLEAMGRIASYVLCMHCTAMWSTDGSWDFYFPVEEGTFCFCFLENGKCELLPYSWWLFLKQRRLVTLAHRTWQGPLSTWRSPRPEIKKPCSQLQGRNHQGRTDSISSPSFTATLGCCRSPSLRLSLTLLSHSVIMSADLARPFTRGCRKRRMCQGRLFGWERAGSCLLGRRRTPRRSE